MKPRVRLAGMILLLGISGCATTLWWGNRSTTLRMGMSPQQAQALLGPPRQVLQQDLNGVMVETWKYLDRTLVFYNGILQSWSSPPSDTP